MLEAFAHLVLGDFTEHILHGLRLGMQPEEQRPVGLDHRAQVQALRGELKHPQLLARAEREDSFLLGVARKINDAADLQLVRRQPTAPVYSMYFSQISVVVSSLWMMRRIESDPDFAVSTTSPTTA
jgi:hypothetical protein